MRLLGVDAKGRARWGDMPRRTEARSHEAPELNYRKAFVMALLVVFGVWGFVTVTNQPPNWRVQCQRTVASMN